MDPNQKDPHNPGSQNQGTESTSTQSCPDPSSSGSTDPKKPPISIPPDPCKGVAPPADPGCAPPKTPSEKDCTPKDPCEEYYKTHDCTDYPGGPCKCSDRPSGTDGLKGTTIRQQLTEIESLVNKPPDGTPADATKKLSEDLKELETEYSGLTALVALFEKDRASIECTFTTQGRKWHDEIHKLCDSNMSCDITQKDIQDAYNRQKQDERNACCGYVHKHYEIKGMQTCQVQAERNEAEARADLDLLKGLNKTFADRLKELEAILTQAIALAKDRRFKAVCAYTLEFEAVWSTLFQVETWCFRRKDCCICCPPCDLLPNTLPCWTVNRYRDEVQKALKALITAKHNRYLWTLYWLKQEADYKLSLIHI